MLFVLGGPSYVGKKTSIAHFMKLYSFSSIIPYTTKPIARRIGETEGIQYHYIPEGERDAIENDEFIFDEPYNYGTYGETTLYAYRKSDIVNAINSYSNFIIHASVGNIKKIYDEYKKSKGNSQNLYLIFLNYSSELTEDFFRQKMPENYSAEDFQRRYNHAKKEVGFYRKNKDKFDEYVSADKAYKICEQLETIILPKLIVMPTSPDKIPGPLSDMDIIYMCEKRKNDPLQIFNDGKQLSIDEVEKLLCGCGIHLTLSSIIRQIKSGMYGTFIDMALEEPIMEELLLKTYPEKSIATGYILRPGETILCSSRELIKMPHDVYAVVASKFSYTQLGLSIELATSVIQSGHNGKVHFQIKNNTNNYICIYPGIQVAQLIFQRTVQPGSNIYHEQKNSCHTYDADSITPVSRFRKYNPVLENIRRPKATFLKKLFSMLKEQIWIRILGLILLLISFIFNWNMIADAFNKYIVSNIAGLDVMLKIVLFGIVCGAVNSLIYAIGYLMLYILKRVKRLYFRTKQQGD